MQIRIILLIKVMGICETTGLQTLQGPILSCRASIVIVHGLPKLYFEPLKLL